MIHEFLVTTHHHEDLVLVPVMALGVAGPGTYMPMYIRVSMISSCPSLVSRMASHVPPFYISIHPYTHVYLHIYISYRSISSTCHSICHGMCYDLRCQLRRTAVCCSCWSKSMRKGNKRHSNSVETCVPMSSTVTKTLRQGRKT